VYSWGVQCCVLTPHCGVCHARSAPLQHLLPYNNEEDIIRTFRTRAVIRFEGYDVNCRGAGGETPLIAATKGKQKSNISLLHGLRADFYARDDSGRDALAHALETGDSTLIQLVCICCFSHAMASEDVAQCVSVVCRTDRGHLEAKTLRQVLHVIHTVGSKQLWPEHLVRQLLRFLDHVGEPDMENERGMTSLHVACGGIQLDLAQQLLARGASLSARAGEPGNPRNTITPIANAIRLSCPRLIRMLVSADSSVRDAPCVFSVNSVQLPMRPLCYAIELGHAECVDALMDLGAGRLMVSSNARAPSTSNLGVAADGNGNHRAKRLCGNCGRYMPKRRKGEARRRGAQGKCAQCRAVVYCSLECQRLDWARHRLVCVKKD
jgi:MYND finger